MKSLAHNSYQTISLVVIVLCCSQVIAQEKQASHEVWQSNFVGSPDPAPPLVLERAFPKLSFSGPISINRMPESNRFFVLEQNNRIYSFEAREDVANADLVIDFSEQKPLCGELPESQKREIELFSIAFHPKFSENHWAFLCYISKLAGKTHTHISRFEVDTDAVPKLLVKSEVNILTCDGGGHNGCTLLFDQAGYLYISIGDLTEPSPPDRLETGQDISDLYASILRIDVDRPDSQRPYSIPQDNPFIRMPSARPEVYAYGFRNPFRMSIDAPTGDLWVGDVGWEAWEMVYRVKSGGNYGWAIKEGPGDVKPQRPGPTPILPADIALGHNEAASVTGGMVYRGSAYPEMVGKYIFGDWVTRKFWAATFDKERVIGRQEIAATQVKPICFETDVNGELLVLDYIDYGTAAGIYRFQRNPAASQPTDRFPRKLSQSGLFKDTKNYQFAHGVVGYTINASMWHDGANSSRLLAIPSDDPAIIFQRAQKTVNWYNTKVKLPVGSVLAKTLSIPVAKDGEFFETRIETQVALKDLAEEWQYYSYRWNEEGTDAELVGADGASRKLTIRGNTGEAESYTWQFSSRSQCRVCHSIWTGETVGFVEEQLRNPLADSDGWRELSQAGYLRIDDEPQPLDNHYSGLVDPLDESLPLDQRARSYLHVNCSHCHMNGGNASTVFRVGFADRLAEARLSEAPMRGELGLRDARIVAPGEPTRSVLLLRLAKQGTGHMPHIGAQRCDPVGVQLIHHWIASLPKDDEIRFALDQLCGSYTQRNDQRRMESAKQLLSTLEGTIELAGAMSAGRVPRWLHRQIVDEAARLNDLARQELIEPFAVGEQRVERLGINFDQQALLQIEGDAQRGRELFAAGVGQCSQCHRVGEVGKEVGPDLSRVFEKLKSREKLLQSILQPSLEIDPKFQTQMVLTGDGKTIVGRIEKRDEHQLVVIDAQAKRVEIKLDEIEFEKASPVSLMPEQLLAQLTAKQAADLLAWLETMR